MYTHHGAMSQSNSEVVNFFSQPKTELKELNNVNLIIIIIKLFFNEFGHLGKGWLSC